jgi:hypothetical protein
MNMATPRSFSRVLRAAHLKLVYSDSRSAQDNLKAFEEVMRRVRGAVPFPVIELVEVEVETLPEAIVEVEAESVLSLPRRERDPALIQQEINGCKNLLLEIIRRAAYDWVLYRTSTRIIHRKLAEQAYTWLFKEEEGTSEWRERTDSGKQITGFMSICLSLDLDPGEVRTHVKRLTLKNVMSTGRPPEYRRREQTAHSLEESPLSIDGSGLEAEWSQTQDEDPSDD